MTCWFLKLLFIYLQIIWGNKWNRLLFYILDVIMKLLNNPGITQYLTNIYSITLRLGVTNIVLRGQALVILERFIQWSLAALRIYVYISVIGAYTHFILVWLSLLIFWIDISHLIRFSQFFIIQWNIYILFANLGISGDWYIWRSTSLILRLSHRDKTWWIIRICWR